MKVRKATLRDAKGIADVLGATRDDVRCLGDLGNIAKLPKPDKSAAEHATDFTVPIYNVWRRQCKTDANEHFGIE